MIVIVTGGRGYEHRHKVFAKLSRLKAEHGQIMVSQGECPTGADLYAREWCDENGLICIGFHPPWKRLGIAAGPVRNAVMAKFVANIAEVAGAVCLHFAGGRGTTDMVDRARKQGLTLIDGEASDADAVR